MSLQYFNFIVNATFSFFAGVLVVNFFLWLFKVEESRWKMLLLTFPFLKIALDLLRGLPENSVLLSNVDPYTLPPRSQVFKISLGTSDWFPTFNASFSVKDLNGTSFASSLGDYAGIWLNRQYGPSLATSLVVVVVAVSSILVVRRILQIRRFQSFREADRREAIVLQKAKVTHWRFERNVDVYLSAGFTGTPFTGGFLKPYVCFPQDAYQALDADERAAVIAHELGHVHGLDFISTVAIQFLGDLFWFVPGFRSLRRKLDRLREILADQWAVHQGLRPASIASALLKLTEISQTASAPSTMNAGFLKSGNFLKGRVQRLVLQEECVKDSERMGRLGWNYRPLRILMTVWILAAVVNSSLGTNDWQKSIQNPEWIENLFQHFGMKTPTDL